MSFPQSRGAPAWGDLRRPAVLASLRAPEVLNAMLAPQAALRVAEEPGGFVARGE